jgi:hypothetical protein
MKAPSFDQDGYPTQKTLEAITTWPIRNNFDIAELLEFVDAAWSHMPFAIRTEGEGRKQYIYCATGGWSGNEGIIAALQQNHLFWGLCWLESRRGGGYKFLTQPIKEVTYSH